MNIISCKRKRRKRFCKVLCFVAVISVLLYICLINYLTDNKAKANFCQSGKRTDDNQTIKYIFNLAYWREVLGRDGPFYKENQTLWCDVPTELRIIANAICRIYDIHKCARLPCRLIHSSPSTLADIKCIHGGQIFRGNDNNNMIQNQSDFQCKRGFALDLFMKKSKRYSYPSIIADAFAPLANDLYINVLNNKYRSCTSIWSVIFNFESISNYPWAADHDKLKLFDVTFGYDRSFFDFIPGPWLFNYVDQIKFTPRRRSIQNVMDSKMPIYSNMSSVIYWTNEAKNSITPQDTTNTSHVRAPIMWMNSNCNTKSQRTQYMRKLMKYIDVDNYGTCGINIRRLPEHIVKLQGSTNRDLVERGTYDWEAGKLALSKEYLFTIAIENSCTYDYITEKLWHPFIAGSVPIYLGAPNVDDWLPCQTDCIIDLRKFATPKDAAMHIKRVASNRTLYESYHRWRSEPVSPKFQNMLNYFERMRNYSFECVLCDMSNRVGQGETAKDIKRKLMETIGRF